MYNLGDQYQCPTGPRGTLVAAMMNQQHAKLTLWGLSKITVGPEFVILDVGCGGGKTMGKLAKMAPQGKVFGLDYSLDMVKFSKKTNKTLVGKSRVEIIQGSVEKIGFREDFFDLVTACETYYFWKKFPDALKEIKRVLKPGGKLLLVNELKYRATPAKVIKETHVKLFSLEEIRRTLQTIGFVGVRVFTEVDSDWNAIVAQKIKLERSEGTAL